MVEAGSGKVSLASALLICCSALELWHVTCGGPQNALVLRLGTDDVCTERLCIRVLITAHFWRGAEKFCTNGRSTWIYRMM